jgi:hypothetical protein
MLVPMELYGLTQRSGYLSPELAVGWQIGRYVHDFFDGLQEVRIAASAGNDAVFALSYLSREHGCFGQITVSKSNRPWDFLFYHAMTGTVLQFILVRKYVELSQALRDLEPHLDMENLDIVAIYQAGVDELVKSILERQADSFCMIRQIRCRPLLHNADSMGNTHCCRCGKPIRIQKAWDIEGEICCQTCSGLEPGWFMFH